MKIALDYDETYTVDPDFWQKFIVLAKAHGHEVIGITKRGPSNQGTITVPNIVFHHSDRQAKFQFAKDKGLNINIWIDDAPQNLFING